MFPSCPAEREVPLGQSQDLLARATWSTSSWDRGRWGAVFRATTRDSGEEVAVKLLREELASDPSVVARFLQERTIMLALDDPALVRVLDFVVESNTVVIVMDLVRGPSLRELLRREGTLTAARAASIVGDVLGGLVALHAAGVIHRDVKPENVLIEAGGEGQARLADFGIARLVDGPRFTRSTGLMGTIEYMAPELFEGLDATSAIDLYGTGVLAFELVCGRSPFSGGPAAAVLRRHLEQEPGRPDGFPVPLWRLVASMLAKDPKQRPSAEESSKRLHAIAPRLVGIAALPLGEKQSLAGTGTPTPRPDSASVTKPRPAPTAHDTAADGYAGGRRRGSRRGQNRHCPPSAVDAFVWARRSRPG